MGLVTCRHGCSRVGPARLDARRDHEPVRRLDRGLVALRPSAQTAPRSRTPSRLDDEPANPEERRRLDRRLTEGDARNDAAGSRRQRPGDRHGGPGLQLGTGTPQLTGLDGETSRARGVRTGHGTAGLGDDRPLLAEVEDEAIRQEDERRVPDRTLPRLVARQRKRMDVERQPAHGSQDPVGRELDRLVCRDGEHQAARPGWTNVDGRVRPRGLPVRRSRVGLGLAGVVGDERRRLVERRFGQVLIGVRDHEARLTPLDRAQGRRRATAGAKLAADGFHRERNEVGRADEVDPHGIRHLAAAPGGRLQQPPAGGEAKRLHRDGSAPSGALTPARHRRPVRVTGTRPTRPTRPPIPSWDGQPQEASISRPSLEVNGPGSSQARGGTIGLVSTTPTPPAGPELSHWETRLRAAGNTTRRQFVYQWTAPRSPVLRLLLAPLFVVAALLLLALFLLVFVLAAAVAILVVVAARLGLLRGRRRVDR